MDMMPLLMQLAPVAITVIVMIVRHFVAMIPGKYVPHILAVAGTVTGLLTGDGSTGALMLQDALQGLFTSLASVGVAEVALAPKRAAKAGK